MSTTPTAIDPILGSIRAGHQTLLVSGRSLYDLHVNERGEIRPLGNSLMRRVREEFAMATLSFNLALGARTHQVVEYSMNDLRAAQIASTPSGTIAADSSAIAMPIFAGSRSR